MSDSFKKKYNAIKKQSKPLGHEPTYKEDGPMIDIYTCSCGWESKPYFDGQEYALDEWMKHAEAIIEKGQAEMVFK